MLTRPIFIRRLGVQFTANFCFPGTSVRPNDVRKKMINDYKKATVKHRASFSKPADFSISANFVTDRPKDSPSDRMAQHLATTLDV